MNAPFVPSVAAGPKLHARRCARHTTREAAVRCPACGEFFCRECVVEHDGKFLCAPCLAKRTAKAAERRGRRLAGLLRVVRASAGVVVLWLVFYWVGTLLLRVPMEVHDGTVWKKLDPGEVDTP